LRAAASHGQDPLDSREEQRGTAGWNPEQPLPGRRDPQDPLGILEDREDGVRPGALGPRDPLEASLLQRVELALPRAQPEAPGLARPDSGEWDIGLAAPRRPLHLAWADQAQGVVCREAPDRARGVLTDHPEGFLGRSAEQGEAPEGDGIEDLQTMVLGARPEGTGAVLQQGEGGAAHAG